MDTLIAEHGNLSENGNLTKSVHDVQDIIDCLQRARDTIATGKDWPNFIERFSICHTVLEAPRHTDSPRKIQLELLLP